MDYWDKLKKVSNQSIFWRGREYKIKCRGGVGFHIIPVPDDGTWNSLTEHEMLNDLDVPLSPLQRELWFEGEGSITTYQGL